MKPKLKLRRIAGVWWCGRSGDDERWYAEAKPGADVTSAIRRYLAWEAL